MSEMLNLSDSAKVVGISRKTLYEHINNGKVSVTKKAGKRCIAVSELIRTYESIDLKKLQPLNTRLQGKKPSSPTIPDTESILIRLQEISEDNGKLREEVRELKEATINLLTNKEDENTTASLRQENEKLKDEIDTLKKRGFFARLWGR
jgi:FtsZ-binding cell division protein ZapB